jgi:hypothetical protein
MHNTRRLEPIHPPPQPRDDIEQLPTNQRGHLERLFEYENRNNKLYFIFNFIFKRRSASLKPVIDNSKRKDAYVS